MSATKIEWCDWTWNPVWGCNNRCSYCYARRINERFKIINDFSSPEWMAHNFEKPFPKKPSRIFVNSMSDISWWQPTWIDHVLGKIGEHPEHTFLFLTKNPGVYNHYMFPDNCMCGVTVTNQAQMDALADSLWTSTWDDKYRMFLSIEPLLEEISVLVRPDWIIIGAMTGPGAKPVKREWVERIVNYCGLDRVPLFTKDSLGKYGIPIIQQFPDGRGV